MINYEDLHICQKLRTIREFQNISMEQMADKLGIFSRMYYRIEREGNDITLRRLVDICNAFNLSFKQFILFNRKDFFQFSQNETSKNWLDKIELQDQLLETKDEIIYQLKKENERLIKENEKLTIQR